MSLQLRITGNDGVTNKGLANISAPEKYNIRDGGKIGKCIRFDSSDNIIYLNIDVTEFTITYWHKEDANIANANQSDLSYGDDTSSIDRKLMNTSTEWTFSCIRINSALQNMHITMGESDYCDIRMYDHILSAHELTLIKQCLIFEHQLGRPQSTVSYKTDSKYGLQDTSGFGHDLSVNGTIPDINWNTASPVGQGFLKFDSSFYLLFDSFGSSLESPDITISFYAFCEDWESTDKYTVLQVGNDIPTLYIKFHDGVIDTLINMDSYSTDISNLKSGWHMFVMTRSAGGISIYADGDLLAHSDISNPDAIVLTDGVIGKLSDGTIGLCDMRIYSTYMTDDDVQMMYNSRIAIDSSGNLYAYSNSYADSEMGFGSNGDVKGVIKETQNTFRMYNDRMECKTFYEI